MLGISRDDRYAALGDVVQVAFQLGDSLARAVLFEMGIADRRDESDMRLERKLVKEPPKKANRNLDSVDAIKGEVGD